MPPRPYNEDMVRDLKPLYRYMARYRWGYLWGSLSLVATNGLKVLFPQVLGRAVNELNHLGPDPAAMRRTILYYAGLVVLLAILSGIFLYASRWILIGVSR